MVAGQPEAERWFRHCYYGRWFGSVVHHVRRGVDKRVTRTDRRPPVGHPKLFSGRLLGGRGLRGRSPVPESVRTITGLLLDGRLARLLDGVPHCGAHDARLENGLRALRPGRMRARRQRSPGSSGQKPSQRTTGETCTRNIKVISKKSSD